MTSLIHLSPLLKCLMTVCPSSLHSCVQGTNFPPSEPPGEIMSFGVSPVNYSDSDSELRECLISVIDHSNLNKLFHKKRKKKYLNVSYIIRQDMNLCKNWVQENANNSCKCGNTLYIIFFHMYSV